MSLDFTLLGNTYTAQDDAGFPDFPTAYFNDQTFSAVSYAFQESTTGQTIDIFQDAVYDPNGEVGTVAYNSAPVPFEFHSTLGIAVGFLLFGGSWLRKRLKVKEKSKT